MPVKGSRKTRICKCGETDLEKFPPTRATECRKCVSTRTAKRTRGRNDLHRIRHLRRAYGFTPERYDAELKKQNGLCAICGKPPDDNGLRKLLVIDHDHKTQKFRGLVHGRCNCMIGYAQDSVETLLAAADYLTKHLEN